MVYQLILFPLHHKRKILKKARKAVKHVHGLSINPVSTHHKRKILKKSRSKSKNKKTQIGQDYHPTPPVVTETSNKSLKIWTRVTSLKEA